MSPDPRSAARLGAVQAIYQMDVVGTDLADIIEEFSTHRLGAIVDGDQYMQADLLFFSEIVGGVVKAQKTIDPLLHSHLAEGWRLSRIDSILRAVLRAGTYELSAREDVPTKVIISEYIDIAHAFFEGEEPKVVNAVLDKIAHQLRTEEFSIKADD